MLVLGLGLGLGPGLGLGLVLGLSTPNSYPNQIKPETRAKLFKLTTGMPFRAFFVACVLSNVIALSTSNNDTTSHPSPQHQPSP